MTLPLLVRSILVNHTSSDTTTLTTGAFTPAAGNILVVKAISADSGLTAATPTSNWTYSLRASSTTASHTGCWEWTAPVTAATSTNVSVAFSGTTVPHSLVVEEWSGAQLAATPAKNATQTGTGAPSATVTTVANDSIVTGLCGDWAAVALGTPVYRSSATEDNGGAPNGHFQVSGQYDGFFFYQAATTAGSQGIGLTAPAGQTWAMLAIELQSSSSTTPITGTDSATGTDSSAVAATLSSTDSATGTDASAVSSTSASTDSGTGTDTTSVSVILGSSDGATGSDSSSVNTGAPGAVHIFTTQTPQTQGFDSNITVGVEFTVDDAETVTSLRYYKTALTDPQWVGTTINMGLWDNSGTLIASGSYTQTGSEPDGWIDIPVTSTPISSGQSPYIVGYYVPASSGYAFTSGELTTTIDNPPLHGTSGCFTYATGLTLPATTSTVNWYADVTLAGTGPTPVTGTDSASGTDTSSVAGTLGSGDSATGADTSATIATLASSDSGGGTDASSVATTLASTESATGSDSSSVSISSSPSSTDAGTGSDASAIVATAASTDLATGSDSSSVLRLIGSSDSAAGDDTVTDITISDVDIDATGTDTATIFVILGSGDSAAGSDSSSVLQTGNNPASGDSGTGSDSSALSVTLASIDASTGLDLAGLVATLTSSDAGAGSDSSNVSIGLISINSGDSGTGTDAASVSVALSSSDLAAALDNGNLWVPIVSSDSVTLVEVSHVGSPTGRNITITGPAVSFTRWLATVSFDQWPATFSS